MANKRTNVKLKVFTIPNIMSMFRICLIPVIVWLYVIDEDIWAGCVLLLSGATDIVDGYIARHFNMISDLGKVLDPIADKFTQGAMLICLVWNFPLMLMPLVLLAIKELFMGVSGIAVVKRTGVVPGANWHGKAATCMLYAMMILHVFWPDIPIIASHISIALCTAIILLSFALYGVRNIKAIKKGERSELTHVYSQKTENK